MNDSTAIVREKSLNKEEPIIIATCNAQQPNVFCLNKTYSCKIMSCYDQACMIKHTRCIY